MADRLPIDSNFVLELDGERYFVQTATKLEGIGGRKWKKAWATVQEDQPANEAIPMTTFHEGAGFTYAGIPNVYEHAGANSSGSSAGSGWDATSPGRLATWQRHGVGSSVTVTTTTRGWLKQLGNFLYMGRGRYLTKYTIDATLGNTWAKSGSDKDFGATNVVTGRMRTWNGKLYVPIANTSNVLQVAQEVTQGSPDTYAALPVGKEARAFFKYRDLLGRVQANGIATCATTPTTAGNWSDDGGNGLYTCGDPNVNATDAIEWQLYIFVAKDDGVWSFADDFYTRNEFPSLETAKIANNCRPLATSGDQVVIPHSSGLIAWLPGNAWKYVGVDQEGALESDLTPGFGQVVGEVARGPVTFIAYKDSVNGRGSICSLHPTKGQRRPIPQMHFECLSGYFEDLVIVTDTAGVEYLAAIHTSSDGLTAEPWIWRLPRFGESPAQDSAVTRAVSNTSFFTSRYFGTKRNLVKTFREVEFWLEASAADLTNTPGLQVWARVDDGSAFQLNSSAGTAATITAQGAQRLFFPPTSAAVGHYCQLEFRVPAITGGQTAISINAIRDTVLRLAYRPRVGAVYQGTLVLGQGEFEDKGSMQRTNIQQKLDLEALAAANSAAVAYKEPEEGEQGYCTLETLQITEAQFKGSDELVWLADVVLRDQAYA